MSCSGGLYTDHAFGKAICRLQRVEQVLASRTRRDSLPVSATAE